MRIQFGAIITQGAGKAGGTIIQRGRTGQILRNLTIPKSRKFQASAAPRSAVSVVSSQWKFLTAAQRTGWTSVAALLTRYNKFGVAYIPTGFQLFCELNLNLVNLMGEAVLPDPQTNSGFPNIQNFVLTVDPGVPSVVLTWTLVTGEPTWFVCVSFFGLQSMGASVPRGSSRQVLGSAVVTAETFNLTSEFIRRFIDVPDGVLQLAIEVNVVDVETGYRLPSLVIMVPYSTP